MRKLGILCCALLLALRPGAAQAQQGFLDQAQSRIANGDMSEARALLQRWRRENPTAARSNPEQQARYHLLSARATLQADSAEDQYLTVAVNYPTTTAAPEALLRLAQARLVRKDTAQAVTYLQRLLADYPTSEQRALGTEWLARSKPASSNVAQAKRSPATPVARRDTTPPPPKPAAAAKPVSEQPRKPVKAEDNEPITSTGVAIQIGAFRELSGARSMKIQLERAGFSDVRLVRVPGNTLIRVRMGKYSNRAAAAATLARLGDKNFNAVLVTDVARESPVSN